MAELTTRAAHKADIEAITAIYASEVLGGTATFEVVPPDAAEMASRLEKVGANGMPFLVAERDGAVVGYAYAGPYHLRPAYKRTVENSIYIAADSRGTGVGGALLRALIDKCTASDFRQMIALIGDSNNVASIRLHKAAGFSLVGTLKSVGYKHNRWVDVVLMQRALGPGDTEPPLF
jgi:phosphinothricin acetyltransferase